MSIFDLQAQLKDFLIFSIKDIEKIDSSFHKQRLSEWQKKGYIKRVRQGFYMFSDKSITEQSLFVVANKIYQPSYVSLEMAFSIFNLIPEGVYRVTSVTSQKTKIFETELGTFAYKHMKPSLMFGYELREHRGYSYAIAEIEKCVLDYLYLNSHIKDQKDFEGLRFNAAEFNVRADMKKFETYLKVFNNAALTSRARTFCNYIEHA